MVLAYLRAMPLPTMVSFVYIHTYIHTCCELCFFTCTVANAQLRGCSDIDAALVQQYVNFADHELLPAACTWTFPTLGIMQYNQQVCSFFVL